VTLVASGRPAEGEEDLACAEWISAVLKGTPPSTESVIATVLNSRAAAKHTSDDLDLPLDDVTCVTAIDAFSFAIKAERREGRVFARPYSQS
jgi:2-phosphosulfolactate phosphatase